MWCAMTFGPASTQDDRLPNKHRTIDRVTQIVEEVVYNPGMTFADLARALDAPRSSVHGFIRGLLANGWLYEDKHRFYLGPAVYGLNIASGHIRAGLVTHADLEQLHRKSGVTVFLGVRVGEHVIYIDEAGTDSLTGFAARRNIRRTLLATAGGKVLLASCPQAERDAYLRRRGAEEAELVEGFLAEYDSIRKTGIARNTLHGGRRFAIATAVYSQSGDVVAETTLVGATAEVLPREQELGRLLLTHVASWTRRSMSPRGAI
jgi:DNA-binding IclR family transcriptional regulator